ARALLLKRAALLLGACPVFVSCGGGLQCESHRLFALLFEPLCRIHSGGRPQLQIGSADRAASLGSFIRQGFWTRLLLQGLSDLRCGRLRGLLELRNLPRLRTRQPGRLRNGLPADRADDILLTGVSRHPGGDLGAEIQTGQRRRNERCGDGESCKSSTRTAGVRGGVRWLKISIVRQRLPMRRRDLAWIAVFTDPFARFRRPVRDIKNPTCIILEDDASGIFDVAHWSPEAGEWISENGEPSKITPTHWQPLPHDRYLQPSHPSSHAGRARRRFAAF